MRIWPLESVSQMKQASRSRKLSILSLMLPTLAAASLFLVRLKGLAGRIYRVAVELGTRVGRARCRVLQGLDDTLVASVL